MDKVYVSCETKLKVEFYDVDIMRIVWHGNYVKFMEAGRCDLLEKIGYGYLTMEKNGYYFPLTDMKLRFVRSLNFREEAVIKSMLIEYENCIKIKYEIYNSEGKICVKAETTQMAVKISTGESQFVCPESLIKAVEDYMKANQ